MKESHVSWNAAETVFHEMLWKLKFHCVYFHLGNKEILEKSQIWVDA